MPRLPREAACQVLSVIPLGVSQNIPAVASLETLALHSRTWVKCAQVGLLTGLVTHWDCRGGFGYQELFPFKFLDLACHSTRCEIKLSSKGADSIHHCTVGVQPPCRVGLSFGLLCDVCIFLCLQQQRFLKWKHLMFTTESRQKTNVWIPKPPCQPMHVLLEAFSMTLSLADRNVLRHASLWVPCAAVTEPVFSMH